MSNLTFAQQGIVKGMSAEYPDQVLFSPKEMIEVADKLNVARGEVYRLMKSLPKSGRGVYNLSALVMPFRSDNSHAEVNTPKESTPKLSTAVQSLSNDEVYIPKSDKYYVAWGNYKDVESIVKSGAFYPVFITGLSGNGKTMMVEQACAKAKREYVRVQITPETDEDDLIGGFRLVDGETVFAKGPVLSAMEKGAILLIDEIDRGSNKMMCLQGVLEGKPVLVKKTGQMIKPAPGFNIIATANTKGRGSDDGRFVAATIIDEAFLERFTITIEQPYAPTATEKRIVLRHMEKYECVDESFAELLTIWSDTIRKTFEDGGVDEVISTRRLCHIVHTFSIFQDRRKAVELCVNRFDADTKEAFIDLYSKVDATIKPATTAPVYDEALNSADPLQSIIDEAKRDMI
jgi:MoxR-like ATPase